ncbi:MAG TPA: TonB-dependent receptor [Kofleriaceae bacterium]
MSKFLKASFLAFGAVGVLGAGSLLQPQEVFAQASSTVGGVRGQIKDKANGEAAIGATVVATSPALVGEQVVITDENGLYFIPSIPPGVYTLTIYYNNQPFSRGNVVIQVGKEAVVNVTVDSAASAGKPAGEVIEIKGTVPIVDQGSTKTGVTITDDYTRNIPTGRTFGGVVGSSAGAQDDFYGVSIGGATSAENVYVVEGINTTDTGFGGISSNLPNEFIAETEVITGGYNAEFGRATGGIVNVVTKSGSNQFKGSVFGYYRPGALVADAEVIQREGAAIDSKADLDYAYDVGAEVGGPIIKDKLWFHVGFNPSSIKSTRTRIVQSLVDANDDGIPDIDPETGFTVREEVNSTQRASTLTTYFFTAKINGAVSANHQFQVSAFGNPRVGELGTASLVRNPANTYFANEDGAYDLSAKWTSKFNEGKTQIDAVVGFHRGFENQTPATDEQDRPFVFYNTTYSRPLFDFAPLEGNIAACEDGSAADKYMMIDNCPTTGYSSQGLGFLEERSNNRTSGVLALTQRVKAGGYHTFKAGIDVEAATYDSTRGITGGGQFRRNSADSATNGPAVWQLRELLKIDRPLTADEDPEMVTLAPGQLLCADDRAICSTTEKATAATDNLGFAAFLQDSWQVLPNLTLNAGVRWEQQTGYVGEALRGNLTPEGFTIPDEAYKINDMWAPRIGLIFDPTKEGKAKIMAHWGRFYESIPMDINVRAFGGEISNFDRINFAGGGVRPSEGDPDYDPNCDVDFDPSDPNRDLGAVLRQCMDRSPQQQLGGGTEFVAPGMKGQYTQELILGAEYELVADFKVGLNYIHRTLPVVIEDMSTDGGSHYIIGNPGSNYDAEAVSVRTQGEAALAQSGCMDISEDPGPTCDGQLQAQAATLLRRASEMEFIDSFDKPQRNYDAVQLTITQRPTGRSLIQASYTYSVSKGNYPGLFSTETNQLDPNLTSLYDLPELMANRYGNMGLDRPHNLKVDAFYQFDLKKAGLLTVGGSARAQSGIAHNALAANLGYGQGESFLLPRGSFARSPVTTQFDSHLSYGRRLNKTTTVEFFARFFNLFDTQDELDVDEIFTGDNANPIVGGRPEDLEHAKILDSGSGLEANQSLTPNKNFGKLNARQAPRSVQLGVRLTF